VIIVSDKKRKFKFGSDVPEAMQEVGLFCKEKDEHIREISNVF
jgi:hypothetical protein